ncbi:MAG: site-specific DNA-methyltransferase [Acidobacteriota bacterium]|nr:site-specific DNA-methyltransferase [Acidobacteriota bacterium]
MADTNFAKFKKLLSDLFMFDQSDLDFGIYRIMNAKREEISRFLDNDLLPQVKSEIEKLGTGDRAQLEQEYRDALEQAQRFGVAEPEKSPPVVEARAKLEASVDVAAIESEVFSHLFNFFRRYYSEGDFLSLRRYKEGVYAIPYEGEEVKLHWANADQYYIKTTEYFSDYTFKLTDGRRVHFKLVSASTEQNNNKAAEGQERRFILYESEPLAEKNGELFIHFEYRPDAEKRKQADLSAETVRRVLSAEGFETWTSALKTKATSEKNANRTLLEKHLTDYTSRNTFDYFIHKDLRGFLRRELDFYIKNEVMHLDDIESEAAPRVEHFLGKVKAMRHIAHKIISFLEQFESFQKKLWLKKKFIIATNYCVTLDRVPEDLYVEITANDAQRDEWVKLFAINEIKGDLTCPDFSTPLTIEFLKANQFLVLDTIFFGQGFKEKLLASFENLDGQTDGLLINSDNFQALGLLENRYRGQIDSIYIDPPYNTGPSEIVYKNDYKDSSWLSLMRDRLVKSFDLITSDAAVAIAIDDYAMVQLCELCDETFPNYDRNLVIVNHHPQGSGGKNISRTHEYMIYLIPAGLDLIRGKEKESGIELRSFMLSGPGDNKSRAGRPNSFYALVVDTKSRKIVRLEPPPKIGQAYPTEDTAEGYKRIYPIGNGGREQVWCRSYESGIAALEKGEIILSDNLSIKFAVDTTGKRSILFSNWVNSKYNAGPHGTKLVSDILGDSELFSYPKSIHLVQDAIDAMMWQVEDPTILDYFAGSGTTAHAVINLNRADNAKRRYVIVEMGNYFDTVTKPRIQKVIYSKDWSEGKPVSRIGSSHLFKYIRLESYEDALVNLELKRTEEQTSLLEAHDEFREDYMLRYMLDVEARGSASLLNVENFADPFSYQINVAAGANVGETRRVAIDLVETFNYLLGLRVRHVNTIRGFRVVEGTNPSGEKVLVIWRNTHEKSNDDLDHFFQKQGYNTRDMEFDLIYANGDNNLENLRHADETWKVRLIEEEFQRLMFDVRDV